LTWPSRSISIAELMETKRSNAPSVTPSMPIDV